MSTWEEIAVPDALLDTSVGKQHQVLAQDIAPSGAYPVIDQGQSFIAGYCDDPSRVIDFALPVIIFGDHTRAFKYVDFPFVLGADGTKVLKPDPEQFDARYFYYAMLALDIPNRGYNRHFKILRERFIPKPPLPEQQRIAQVLSTVQEAIAQQERLIRTTTELKQALMQKLFTEGLRGEALKETEIGRVPESWEVMQLQEVADVKSGKRLPKGNALVAEDTGYPYIRVTDFEDNSVLSDQLLFVPTVIQPRIQRYIIEKDDVYISVAGSIGIVGMIPEELDGANLTENANRLVITNRKRIEPRYLMYWLDSERCQHEIKAQTLKNAQPKLGLGRIKTLGVALPSLDEQKEIVRALDAVRSKRQVAERKTKTLQDLFRTLLHELMTGKVRVDHELEHEL